MSPVSPVSPVNAEHKVRQQGMLPWLFQRVSGIFLAFTIAVHLWIAHIVHADQLTWETITVRMQDGVVWTIYYLLFIPVVVYHAFNGIWGIVLDYGPSPVIRRFCATCLWIGGLGLVAYGFLGLKSLIT